MELTRLEAAALHDQMQEAVRDVVAELFRSHGMSAAQFETEWRATWDLKVHNALASVLLPKISR